MIIVIIFIVGICALLLLDAYFKKRKHNVWQKPSEQQSQEHEQPQKKAPKPSTKFALMVVATLGVFALLWRLGLGQWALSALSIVGVWLFRHMRWLPLLWPYIKKLFKK